jgi:F-type H+-transporting ATPase subunit alpha
MTSPRINVLRMKENGVVTEIRQDVVHVTGLTNCMNGQLVDIGGKARGVVLGFNPDYVLVLLVSAAMNIRPGDIVTSVLEEFKVPVGEKYLGRSVNALCEPMDGHGPIFDTVDYPIFATAPTVLERVPLNQTMEMGTKIIDMMKPVGMGQRMLVLGDRMTGKTTLCVDAILNQRGKNVICIYCCIGKSDASLRKITDLFEKEKVWGYGIVIAATASDPIGQQYLAPYVACSLGEYFMLEKQADVLIVFDDFTKHAWAYRQISLLLERAPGRDAYPGDIFYIHSQLVERACKLNMDRGGGSMTHLPIVETLQGDLAGYIPSNIVSMTDGQIFTSAQLFGEGFKPAIDMGLSVSRIGNKVQWHAVRKQTGMLQLEFVRYKELEKLTRIRAGSSGDVEDRLRRGRVLEEVLKQDENNPVPMENEVIILFALHNGFLDDCEPADVRSLLDALIKKIRRDKPELVRSICEQKMLTEPIRQGLEHEVKSFGPAYV